MLSALKVPNSFHAIWGFLKTLKPNMVFFYWHFFQMFKVCSTASCIGLVSLGSDWSSRHSFDMMISISNNESCTILGSKRSYQYPLISGLGLTTSAWSRASKISLYFSKQLLQVASCGSHLVTTALTRRSAFIQYTF